MANEKEKTTQQLSSNEMVATIQALIESNREGFIEAIKELKRDPVAEAQAAQQVEQRKKTKQQEDFRRQNEEEFHKRCPHTCHGNGRFCIAWMAYTDGPKGVCSHCFATIKPGYVDIQNRDFTWYLMNTAQGFNLAV
jgi:hypothetical protein